MAKKIPVGAEVKVRTGSYAGANGTVVKNVRGTLVVAFGKVKLAYSSSEVVVVS